MWPKPDKVNQCFHVEIMIEPQRKNLDRAKCPSQCDCPVRLGWMMMRRVGGGSCCSVQMSSVCGTAQASCQHTAAWHKVSASLNFLPSLLWSKHIRLNILFPSVRVSCAVEEGNSGRKTKITFMCDFLKSCNTFRGLFGPSFHFIVPTDARFFWGFFET